MLFYHYYLYRVVNNHIVFFRIDTYRIRWWPYRLIPTITFQYWLEHLITFSTKHILGSCTAHWRAQIWVNCPGTFGLDKTIQTILTLDMNISNPNILRPIVILNAVNINIYPATDTFYTNIS